jgi:hypothetical protein
MGLVYVICFRSRSVTSSEASTGLSPLSLKLSYPWMRTRFACWQVATWLVSSQASFSSRREKKKGFITSSPCLFSLFLLNLVLFLPVPVLVRVWCVAAHQLFGELPKRSNLLVIEKLLAVQLLFYFLFQHELVSNQMPCWLHSEYGSLSESSSLYFRPLFFLLPFTSNHLTGASEPTH